uniref:Uncharacterized protein n=1 Tax=Arundo donax TaxID=35708 RepID=A0A0A8ZT86_ARUDO
MAEEVVPVLRSLSSTVAVARRFLFFFGFGADHRCLKDESLT